jgi:hypothetical protein
MVLEGNGKAMSGGAGDSGHGNQLSEGVGT